MNRRASQAPAVPLSTSYEKDKTNALSREPRFQLDGEIPIAEVGQTIPIVFCKRVAGVGGAWTVPTLARTGLQNSTVFAIFSHALILSEGQITTPVADFDTDVLFAGFNAVSSGFSERTNVVSYGSLPSGLTYGENLVQEYNFKTSTVFTDFTSVGGTAVYLNTPAPLTEVGTGSASYTAPEYCTRISATVDSFSTDFIARWTETYTDSSIVVTRSRTVDSIITWNYEFLEDGVVEEDGSFIASAIFTRPTALVQPSLTLNLGPPEYTPLELQDNPTGGIPFVISDVQVTDRTRFRLNIQERPPYILPDPIRPDLVYRSATTGDFTNITLLGFKARTALIQPDDSIGAASNTDVDLINSIYNKQITVFCSNGINVTSVLTGSVGPSNNIADLINYLALKYAKSISVNTPDLQTVANFTNTNNLFFNGVISTAVNFKEWLETIAPFFLLTPVNLESQISARPALPITAGNALQVSGFTPAFTFEEKHIAAGSYSIEYVPVTERRPFEAVMLWRDQGLNTIANTKPFNTTIKVRFASDTGELPQEQYDMSDFCVTQAHATMAAKFILSKRRRITHSVSFTTDLFSAQNLRPGSLIAIELDRVNSVGDNRTETTYYLVDSITRSMTGTARIVGEHFPIAGGASVIATDITSGSFTVT
jgi:hypothetical protein